MSVLLIYCSHHKMSSAEMSRN